MSFSMAASILRRTLRHPLSSHRVLFYSSFARRPSAPLIRVAAAGRRSSMPSSVASLRFASSKAVKAEDNLKRVLDSEIECAEQEQTEEIPTPDDFPFEIIDNPGDQTIVLKREFSGEKIEVTVFMNLEGEEEVEGAEDDEDDSGDESNTGGVQPTLSLVVAIDKGVGSHVEFCCNLNADELSIESMALKKRDDPEDQNAYQGPEFTDLDEKLQKAVHKYLEVRGIGGSMFDFLQTYMISKDDREYLTWLQSMKKFIEK